MTDYSSWKVADLREELTRRGLNNKGVKKELIERLEEIPTENDADSVKIPHPDLSIEANDEPTHLDVSPVDNQTIEDPIETQDASDDTDTNANSSILLSSKNSLDSFGALSSTNHHPEHRGALSKTPTENEEVDHEADAADDSELILRPLKMTKTSNNSPTDPLNTLANDENRGQIKIHKDKTPKVSFSVLLDRISSRSRIIEMIQFFGELIPGGFYSHDCGDDVISCLAIYKDESSAQQCVQDFGNKYTTVIIPEQSSLSMISNQEASSILKDWNISIDDSLVMHTKTLPSLTYRPVCHP